MTPPPNRFSSRPSANHRYADFDSPILGPAPTVRILVVDSDDDTRALYRETFHLTGYEVIEAVDGREGLTRALAQPPALVLTEARLPFIDGYGLCDILRRDRETAAVPILVITSDARSDSAERARTAGADAVLVKPTTPAQVLATSRRLLDEGRGSTGRASAMTQRPAHEAVERQHSLSRAFARFVTCTPPASPPPLLCPSCDQPLIYERSYIGGVSARQPEQWDEYACPVACGTFQYRHRTRRLRHTA